MDYHDKDDLELLSLCTDDQYRVIHAEQIEQRRLAQLKGLEEKVRAYVTSFNSLIVKDSTRYVLSDYGDSTDEEEEKVFVDSGFESSDHLVADQDQNPVQKSRNAQFREATSNIRELRNVCAEGFEHQHAIWHALINHKLLRPTLSSLARLAMRCDKLEIEALTMSSVTSTVEYSLILTWAQFIFNLTAANNINRTRIFHTLIAPYLELPSRESFPADLPYDKITIPSHSSGELPVFSDVHRFWKYVLGSKATALRECGVGIIYNTIIRDVSVKETMPKNDKRGLWDCYQWGETTDVAKQTQVRFLPYRIHALVHFPASPTYASTRQPSTLLNPASDSLSEPRYLSWLMLWTLFPDVASSARLSCQRAVCTSAEGGVGLSPELLLRAVTVPTAQAASADLEIYDEAHANTRCCVGILPDSLWPLPGAYSRLEQLVSQQSLVDAHDRQILRHQLRNQGEDRKETGEEKVDDREGSHQENSITYPGVCYALSERERIERLTAEASALNSKMLPQGTKVETLGTSSPATDDSDSDDTDYETDADSDTISENGDPKFGQEEKSIWRGTLLRFVLLSCPYLVEVVSSALLRTLAVLARSLRGASMGLPPHLRTAFNLRMEVRPDESAPLRRSGIALPSEREFNQLVGAGIHWADSERIESSEQMAQIETVLEKRARMFQIARQFGSAEIGPVAPLTRERDAWSPTNSWARGACGDNGDLLASYVKRFARNTITAFSKIAVCLDITATEMLEYVQHMGKPGSLWIDKSASSSAGSPPLGSVVGVQPTVAVFCRNLGSWLSMAGALAECAGGLPPLCASKLTVDIEQVKKTMDPSGSETLSGLAEKSIYPRMQSDELIGPQTAEAAAIEQHRKLENANSMQQPSQGGLGPVLPSAYDNLGVSPHSFSASMLYLLHPAVHALATVTSALVDENNAVGSSEDIIEDETCSSLSMAGAGLPRKRTRGMLIWEMFFEASPRSQETGVSDVSSGILLHAALAFQLVYPRIFRVGPNPSPLENKTPEGESKESRCSESESISSPALLSRIQAVAIAALIRSLVLADNLDVPSHAGDGLSSIEAEAQDRALAKHYKKQDAINVSPESYKCDVIRALGHIAYLCGTPLQTLLGDWGALELILNHCYLDVNNPYIREWSILSIRHLTYEHYANQTRIANLALQGVHQSKTLENMGLKAWIDHDTGKIRVASDPSRAQAALDGHDPIAESKSALESGIQLVNSITGLPATLQGELQELDIDPERLAELEHNSINAKF